MNETATRVFILYICKLCNIFALKRTVEGGGVIEKWTDSATAVLRSYTDSRGFLNNRFFNESIEPIHKTGLNDSFRLNRTKLLSRHEICLSVIRTWCDSKSRNMLSKPIIWLMAQLI